MNSVKRANQIAREFDESEKEAQRRLDKFSGLRQKIKALQAKNERLKEGFGRIISEANKPAFHEKTWKEQARQWEISFMVAKLISEQALK